MIKIMLTASEKVKSLLSSISSDNSVKNTGLFTSPTTQSLLGRIVILICNPSFTLTVA